MKCAMTDTLVTVTKSDHDLFLNLLLFIYEPSPTISTLPPSLFSSKSNQPYRVVYIGGICYQAAFSKWRINSNSSDIAFFPIFGPSCHYTEQYPSFFYGYIFEGPHFIQKIDELLTSVLVLNQQAYIHVYICLESFTFRLFAHCAWKQRITI